MREEEERTIDTSGLRYGRIVPCLVVRVPNYPQLSPEVAHAPLEAFDHHHHHPLRSLYEAP